MSRRTSLLLSIPLIALGSSCKLGSEKDDGAKTLAAPIQTDYCDVIVAGGSTAGLAAGIAAAREFEAEGNFNGRKRLACLLEPTDWAGGQMTSSGVTAIDFAHHSVPDAGRRLNLSRLTRDMANNPRVFAQWMNGVGPALGNLFESNANPGQCWVSVRCAEPARMVELIHTTLFNLQTKGYLKIHFNTVVVNVIRHSREIKSVISIQHTPKNSDPIWHRRLSSVIQDWYTSEDSEVYTKKWIRLEGPQDGNGTRFPVVIDGTEFGDVMVLSRAPYIQGVEKSEDTPLETNETCGQAIVYPIAIELKGTDVPLPGWFAGIESKIKYPQHYSINEPGKNFTWDDVWTYRRIRKGQGAPLNTYGVPGASVGDISSQNWTLGNDYPYRYLFLSKAETDQQLRSWKGGIDFTALDEAEMHALGWFRHLREKAPRGLGSRLALSTANGTSNGLSKVPYLRDTRRSVGIGDFVLKYNGGIQQGTRYEDSIAIGAYAADVHATRNAGCSMPRHVTGMSHTPNPFQLPFRAHTNKDLDNFLVAGKLMAQTFAANAATRLHPIEFSSGTGVGVAAAFMQKWQISAKHVVDNRNSMKDIQTRITALHGPIAFQNLEAARE